MKETVLYTAPDVTKEFATLHVLDKSGEIKSYPLEDLTRIGRYSETGDAEIKVNSAITSRRHGEIMRLPTGYCYRDVGSVNGTYINGVLFGDKGDNDVCMLSGGDVLRIDQANLRKRHPESVLMIFTPGRDTVNWHTQILDENTGDIQIGREVSSKAGVRVESELISRKHATFVHGVKGWSVIDHESTNGVYVNNQRISQPMPLYPLDVVRIANTQFIFLGDKLIYDAEEAADGKLSISIKERSVKQMFKKHVILQDINLEINPGEMVLILGGSGAGKTTFMNAVMGYEKADGVVMHGDVDIYKDYAKMKYKIGFVPQQDLMRGEDTVIATLNNAAQMKMPSGTKSAEREARIASVMEMLGLATEKNSLVKKLSGGQRKRLSIAIEFIADPSLFFLDEPDSGLDGIMATSLMENLRVIADEGKIVMVITHAPDRVAKLFDKVIVLAKSVETHSGTLAFFGSIPEAKGFFDSETLEGVVKRINRPDEGGDGLADHYISLYKQKIEEENR
ncbi:MAG: FHA domain-containing protein [Clostridia bacterium]|nr:FHA domain-containing protein [Clostridia bacterium]